MLNNIGIIGEGKMGTNLVYYLLDMNFSLTWICSLEADIDKLHKTFNKRLSRTLEAGIIDEKRFQNIMNQVIISNNIKDLSKCELIIEAISENGEAKKQLFHKLDRVASASCIFASNSSSINPSQLIPSESRRKTFVGLHFFYPIALKDIVEIILTSETSKETLSKIIYFLKTINRKHLILEEKDSFILNRIFLNFQNEAFLLVNNNKASLDQIDRIVKEHFFSSGVFEFFDSVGLDVMLASVKNYSTTDPSPERFYPLIDRLQQLVSAGMLGKKTKRGFLGEGLSFDPGYPENDVEIISKLRTTYEHSFSSFCNSSGIPAIALKSAMDEYFGSETPLVI
jgi:3-hydroxybutyryl-CoA dehydrogenase